jgi:hypothetical protein
MGLKRLVKFDFAIVVLRLGSSWCGVRSWRPFFFYARHHHRLASDLSAVHGRHAPRRSTQGSEALPAAALPRQPSPHSLAHRLSGMARLPVSSNRYARTAQSFASSSFRSAIVFSGFCGSVLPHGAGQKFLRTSRLRVRTDRGTRSSFSADPGVIFASADQVCVGGGSLVEMHRDRNVAVSCPSRATRPQSCPSRASLVHPQS